MSRRRRIPNDLRLLARLVRNGDGKSVLHFLTSGDIGMPREERLRLLWRMYRVSRNVECAHNEVEILSFARAIVTMPPSVPGVIVEAGCFKGGSTAKFSLFARAVGREMVVFDSFAGIPDNSENHFNIHGGTARFDKGDYCGQLEEVRENVRRYGDVSVCRFVKGYFEDSMPTFREPVAGAYLDVDLISSTKTCLKYLWPLLTPGGVIYSQDGHLHGVLDVFREGAFWNEELGCPPPDVVGAGRDKVVWFRKPLTTEASLARAR